MATYNGNDIFLERDGVDISGLFRDVTYNPTNAAVDVTAGPGVNTMIEAAGLDTFELTGTVVYDDAQVATVLPKLKQGSVFNTIFGPEGNGAGKPKFECMMLSTGLPHTVTHAKALVTLAFSFRAAAQPVSEINNGDVF